MGRFISPDTIVPDPGLVADYNRYMMVRGNPVKFSDPSGHEPCATGSWGDCIPSPHPRSTWTLAQSRYNDGQAWNDLNADTQAVLDQNGLPEGAYNNQKPSAKVQTGLKDPATVAALLYASWRLKSLTPSWGDGSENTQEPYETVDRNSLESDVADALDKIESGAPRHNVRNPQPFTNDDRGNTPQLPFTDSDGHPIIYEEHTVNPRPPGQNLDGKRIIKGSDGSTYYTPDHFESWQRLIE